MAVLLRLDHVLLAVADLDAATRDFRELLGMNVVVGGIHPTAGTHNALVHFGNAYLELIAVRDPAIMRAQTLSKFLAQGDGPYTFALAVNDLDDDAHALENPRDGSRRTPSGAMLRWRSADLRAQSGAPLPFLIQWLADDPDGRAWFRDRVELARHTVGWGSVHALLIATPDPAALAEEYVRLFGWVRQSGSSDRVMLTLPGGDSVNPALGSAPAVALVRPAGRAGAAGGLMEAALAARLEKHGPGFVGLAVDLFDLSAATHALRARGTRVEAHEQGGLAVVDPADAHGMLLELIGTLTPTLSQWERGKARA